MLRQFLTKFIRGKWHDVRESACLRMVQGSCFLSTGTPICTGQTRNLRLDSTWQFCCSQDSLFSCVCAWKTLCATWSCWHKVSIFQVSPSLRSSRLVYEQLYSSLPCDVTPASKFHLTQKSKLQLSDKMSGIQQSLAIVLQAGFVCLAIFDYI